MQPQSKLLQKTHTEEMLQGAGQLFVRIVFLSNFMVCVNFDQIDACLRVAAI